MYLSSRDIRTCLPPVTRVEVMELSSDDRMAADELWRAMRPVLAGCATPEEWDTACEAWRNYHPLPVADGQTRDDA